MPIVTTWYLKPIIFYWLFQLDGSKSLHEKMFHQTSIKKSLFRVPGKKKHLHSLITRGPVPPYASDLRFPPKNASVAKRVMQVVILFTSKTDIPSSLGTQQFQRNPKRCKTPWDCDGHDSTCWTLKRPLCAEQVLELKFAFRDSCARSTHRILREGSSSKMKLCAEIYSGVNSEFRKCALQRHAQNCMKHVTDVRGKTTTKWRKGFGRPTTTNWWNSTLKICVSPHFLTSDEHEMDDENEARTILQICMSKQFWSSGRPTTTKRWEGCLPCCPAGAAFLKSSLIRL